MTLPTHYPSSKGDMPISGMAYKHIESAMKAIREGRKEIDNPDEMLRALDTQRDFLSATVSVIGEQPAPIGDNGGPPLETTFDKARDRLSDLIEEARNWIDGTPIETQEQADQVGKLKAMLVAAIANLETLRKGEKKPHDDAIAEIQTRFNALIGETKAVRGTGVVALEAINKAITAFLVAEDAKREAAAKAAREAADKAAQEAWEAAEAVDDMYAPLEAVERREEAVTVAKQAERQAVKVETARPAVGGGARAQTLRSYWHAEIEDGQAMLKHYWRTDPKGLEALALKLAETDVASGKRTIPGVRVVETKRAV